MNTGTLTATMRLPFTDFASSSEERVIPEEDTVLVRRAQGGDSKAFEQLYHRHAGRVHALALRLCTNSGEAEELTQDAFVRAWEKLTSFRGECKFSTWMHRLTVNLFLSGRRNAGRREARVISVADPALLGATAPGRTPGVAGDLEAAIARLPEGARIVFVLYDVEGYAHHEIAAMTGTAEGTCKAQLHRARRLLREMLA